MGKIPRKVRTVHPVDRHGSAKQVSKTQQRKKNKAARKARKRK